MYIHKFFEVKYSYLFLLVFLCFVNFATTTWTYSVAKPLRNVLWIIWLLQVRDGGVSIVVLLSNVVIQYFLVIVDTRHHIHLNNHGISHLLHQAAAYRYYFFPLPLKKALFFFKMAIILCHTQCSCRHLECDVLRPYYIIPPA